MARCDYCGNECTSVHLPALRGDILPGMPPAPCSPVHHVRLMEEKPAPGVGISYKRGGTATATDGGYGTVSRREKTAGTQEGTPWLKNLIAIVIIILLVILFMALNP